MRGLEEARRGRAAARREADESRREALELRARLASSGQDDSAEADAESAPAASPSSEASGSLAVSDGRAALGAVVAILSAELRASEAEACGLREALAAPEALLSAAALKRLYLAGSALTSDRVDEEDDGTVAEAERRARLIAEALTSALLSGGTLNPGLPFSAFSPPAALQLRRLPEGAPYVPFGEAGAATPLTEAWHEPLSEHESYRPFEPLSSRANLDEHNGALGEGAIAQLLGGLQVSLTGCQQAGSGGLSGGWWWSFSIAVAVGNTGFVIFRRQKRLTKLLPIRPPTFEEGCPSAIPRPSLNLPTRSNKRLLLKTRAALEQLANDGPDSMDPLGHPFKQP